MSNILISFLDRAGVLFGKIKSFRPTYGTEADFRGATHFAGTPASFAAL